MEDIFEDIFEEKKEKINTLIIDGNNLTARANYAEPNLCKSDGTPTGVVYVSIRSIKMLVDKFDCKNIIIIFDKGRSQWRMNLYPDYKSNRNNSLMTVEELAEKQIYINQIKRFREYLEYLPIINIQIEKTEADDVIAHIINKSIQENKAKEIVLVSNDSDFYQFIPFGIKIYDGIKQTFIDEKYILNKFSVPSNQYIFYKSMLGDKTDNISSIKGFGNKAAATLIQKSNVNNIDELKEIAKGFKGKKYEDFINGFDIIQRNYKLINLINQDLISEEAKQEVEKHFKDKKIFNQKIFDLCVEDEINWDKDFFKSFMGGQI